MRDLPHHRQARDVLIEHLDALAGQLSRIVTAGITSGDFGPTDLDEVIMLLRGLALGDR
jgi:hypothetical protein